MRILDGHLISGVEHGFSIFGEPYVLYVHSDHCVACMTGDAKFSRDYSLKTGEIEKSWDKMEARNPLIQ